MVSFFFSVFPVIPFRTCVAVTCSLSVLFFVLLPGSHVLSAQYILASLGLLSFQTSQELMVPLRGELSGCIALSVQLMFPGLTVSACRLHYQLRDCKVLKVNIEFLLVPAPNDLRMSRLGEYCNRATPRSLPTQPSFLSGIK